MNPDKPTPEQLRSEFEQVLLNFWANVPNGRREILVRERLKEFDEKVKHEQIQIVSIPKPRNTNS